MILIISENDQIVGADKEFIGDSTFDETKDKFPSMSVFMLQSENGKFKFNYNDKEYSVIKYPIILDSTSANLYYFETDHTSYANLEMPSKKIVSSAPEEVEISQKNDIPEELELNLDFGLSNDEPKKEINDNSGDLELSLDFGDIADNKSETETTQTPELNLDFGLSNDEPKKEINNNSDDLELSLDFGDIADNKSETETTQTPELNLDFGLSNDEPKKEINNNSDDLELSLDFGDIADDKPETETIQTPELNLDFGLSNDEPKKEIKPITISKSEINTYLKQASEDLGIDDKTITEFFNDFKKQILQEKKIFDLAISNNDYETIHKTAHQLKGVALNLRLTKFGELFKSIDKFAKKEKNIEQIKQMLDNIYSVIEDSKTEINIDSLKEENPQELNIIKDDLKILLKSLVQLLDDLKSQDVDTIKKELEKAYDLIPMKELKEISSKNSVNELQNSLKEYNTLLEQSLDKTNTQHNHYNIFLISK